MDTVKVFDTWVDVVGMVAMSLALIAGSGQAASSAGKSLYDRVGGKSAITAVVETSWTMLAVTSASRDISAARISRS